MTGASTKRLCAVCGTSIAGMHSKVILCSEACRRTRGLEQKRGYRAADPEQRKHHDRVYREANRERRREQQRAYYAAKRKQQKPVRWVYLTLQMRIGLRERSDD